MTNLTRFDKDGIEILIDTQTGESFASISGYARMANISKQAISKRCTVNQSVLKTAEIDTTSGIRTVNLITEDTICEWIIKDNPFMASQLLKLGVRMFLHQLAGIEKESITHTPQLTTKATAIEWGKHCLSLGIHNDGYIHELLKQLTIQELSLVQNTKQLTSTVEPIKDVTICTVRANELGYTPQQYGNGAALGAFVKKRITPVFKKRIGQFATWHYEVNNELDHAIHQYFKQKSC